VSRRPDSPVEVGGTVSTDVRRVDDHIVVGPGGPLSLSTAPRIGQILLKLLADGPAVLADLARLRFGWAPAVEVFPMTLQSSGGWPTARLVLFGAAELTARMQAQRVPQRVPLVDDHAAARARMDDRPEVVRRHFTCCGPFRDISPDTRLMRHATTGTSRMSPPTSL
jgi:hypothetical protein